MKRIILLLLGAGFGLTAFAQTDQGRDLSKYADDKFSADDQYTVAVPYQTVSVKPVKSKKIKNVIVLVGDGMGLEQISVGWTLNGGHLNLDNFRVAGYSRTWASDRLVTDSSAGGTGISFAPGAGQTVHQAIGGKAASFSIQVSEDKTTARITMTTPYSLGYADNSKFNPESRDMHIQ